ncbi:hydrolase 2, exosortase A system-associated [Rhodoferax sp. WC2427]|uniref:hydrolase 2, exosortase A system-associated n=1 Tax=Rhodoferax sp. WC2427 TaxID=3234144 RepID=UPI0034667642
MDAFFLPVGSGQRFAIFHPAQGGTTHGLVAYVHPFAEEMNKSRRMAALQAKALAAHGYAVLQLDLLGCGDSSGDFGDASWQDWVDDVVRACQWLRRQGDAPVWLWGLRAGCLLAAQAAAQLEWPCNFLFWAPTPAGKPLLQQFLRLKAAGDLASGNAKTVMDGLRAQLAAGSPVDIAGYTLSAALASGMEQATLVAPATAGRLEWLDVSSQVGATLSPAAAKPLQAWQAAGFSVRSQVVMGPAFWQTSEIEEAPALLTATLVALEPPTLVGPQP